jgi:hypothetical protein
MLPPEKLKRLAQHRAGEQWLAMLPRMVADLAERWLLAA